MKVTSEQKELMVHTMKGGRNFFGTNYCCRDATEFDKLVEGGLATKEDAPIWSGDDVIYRLNEDGKFIALS